MVLIWFFIVFFCLNRFLLCAGFLIVFFEDFFLFALLKGLGKSPGALLLDPTVGAARVGWSPTYLKHLG